MIGFSQDEALFMRRCFDLARLGAGHVSPNPMVGAVLVYQGRVIGEGFHAAYGQAHAEVNAVASVAPADLPALHESTLYVSLEPCCVFGKTPPCTNLILSHQIPKVVVSCIDPSPGVNGKGMEVLRAGGVDVRSGLLQEEGEELIRARRTFVQAQRPYVVLKWAETQQGIIAPSENVRYWISGPYSRRLTHRLRMEADAILVGGGTALTDDPELNNRYYFGKSPLKVVVSPNTELPPSLKLFQGKTPTLYIHSSKRTPGSFPPGVTCVSMEEGGEELIPAVLAQLAARNIGIVLAEGGAQILNAFIRLGLWDEAWVFQSKTTFIREGLPAPRIPVPCTREETLGGDRLLYYRNQVAQ
ncbi:MAG: Riboflavin biosynthesis protein RibD [Haliscomenobacter sp.]|nr:Riboflavin biosynthesis protein RibD [Haliscomenobacter sp.]